MKTAVRILTFAGVVIALLVVAAFFVWESRDKYLFEVIEKPKYTRSWNALFSGEQDVPSWLRIHSKTPNWVASPSKKVVIVGQKYEAYFICKPHECDNAFYVLFTPGGERAWGLSLPDERFYGKPSTEMQALLEKEARK